MKTFVNLTSDSLILIGGCHIPDLLEDTKGF